MPPRPVLSTPKGKAIDGKEYLQIHQLKEPARTGLVRWLYHHKRPPTPTASAPEGLVDYATFHEFLGKAV
jgi:hypothetical protein